MAKTYILESGSFYQDGYPVAAFSSTRKLVEYVKKKYPDATKNADRDLYFEDFKRRVWYRGTRVVELDPESGT